MFESIEAAPRDPILGLTDAFKADPNPQKINLGVGIYQDDNGETPVLGTVVEATRRVVAAEKTKSYLPIPGAPAFGAAVERLLLGSGHEATEAKRLSTSHTPGGTGALRVVGDFLKQNLPRATVWMTDPTWANHPAIFAAAGVATKTFPYFDKGTNALALDAMLDALRRAPAGDAVLLHACCHNPTGIDPTPEEWRQIADAVLDAGLLPVLDFAYQGFAEGIEADTAGLREFCRSDAELVVCGSFSKNFGLYRERVGAVTFVAADAGASGRVQSQVNRAIRTIYSNPPAHGAAVVQTILDDADLRTQWEGEVAAMRNRINGMRRLFVQKLAEHGVGGDYSFIERQRGMFSFSGLQPEHVEALKQRHAIYAVGNGRINVAGITTANIDRLCEAIAAVVGS
ncbi:MAG: aromatic amino acid transaminase [Lacipirellulaceae bacterium]